MKIPVKPKTFEELISDIKPERFIEILQHGIGPEQKGNYYHWDKLKHLTPPDGISSLEWWLAITYARSSLSKILKFKSKFGKPFKYASTESLYKKLHLIDQKAGGTIAAPESDLLNPDTRDRYLINSLFEEAITSSQLEGAATTGKVAKEMLRTNRKPRNKSERMIVNNYRAMLFIREKGNEPLTPELIKKLHTIVCEGTLDNSKLSGKFRRPRDTIQVHDDRDGTVLHIPPKAEELKDRIRLLCQFANEPETEDTFLHPVVKSILLHFMIGYDHPFVDGNGRTARALFYWHMAKHSYWLIEFISISSILKKAPAKYARAFLYTETDSNDLTYFLVHQLDVILSAIDELNKYVNRKAKDQRKVDRLLRKASGKLINHRQIALISHAIRHPDTIYTIRSHKNSHGITYETSRTDLQALCKLKFLELIVRGNKHEYVIPDDLEVMLNAKTQLGSE